MPTLARKLTIVAAFSAIILSIAISADAQTLSSGVTKEEVRQGRAMARAYCARCHAIGLHDKSHHPDAPPFRTLSQRYPIDSLQEAFAEGISVGHPDMPEWRFEPDQIRRLLGYLESIQPPSQRPP